MWRKLNDPELVQAYRKELPGPSPAIEQLLATLAERPELANVSAVTSHGELRLTAAPSYEEEDAFLYIDVLRSGPDFIVRFSKPEGVDMTSRRCSASDLESVVDLYLIRFLLESE